MAILLACLSWCHAHPFVVFVAVSVVCSLAHDYLERFPRMQGVFRVLGGFGIDVPKIVSGIVQALTGDKPRMPPNLLGLVLLVSVALGCSGSKPVVQQPADVVTYGGELQACVRAADGSLAAADECMRQVKAKWCGDGGAFAGHCVAETLDDGMKAAGNVETQTAAAQSVVEALQ